MTRFKTAKTGTAVCMLALSLTSFVACSASDDSETIANTGSTVETIQEGVSENNPAIDENEIAAEQKERVNVSYSRSSREDLPQGSLGDTSISSTSNSQTSAQTQPQVSDTTVHSAIPDSELPTGNPSVQAEQETPEAQPVEPQSTTGETTENQTAQPPEGYVDVSETPNVKAPIDYSAPSVVVPSQTQAVDVQDNMEVSKQPTELVQDISPIREDKTVEEKSASIEDIPDVANTGAINIDSDLQEALDSPDKTFASVVRSDSDGVSYRVSMDVTGPNTAKKLIETTSVDGSICVDETTLTKNEEGNLYFERNFDGALAEYKNVNFNENGFVTWVSEASFVAGAEIMVEKTYSYTDDGALACVSVTEDTPDADPALSIINYTYDEKGRLDNCVKSEVTTEGVEIKTTQVYSYNDIGEVTVVEKQKTIDGVAESVVSTTIEKSENTMVTKSVVKDTEENTWETIVATEYNDDGTVSCIEWASVKDGIETVFARNVYTYNAEGQPLHTTYVDAAVDGVKWAQETYCYNDEGTVDTPVDTTVLDLSSSLIFDSYQA